MYPSAARLSRLSMEKREGAFFDIAVGRFVASANDISDIALLFLYRAQQQPFFARTNTRTQHCRMRRWRWGDVAAAAAKVVRVVAHTHRLLLLLPSI